MLRLAATCLLAGLTMAPAVRAQGTISTDRPGLGLSSVTVPRGSFQIELGVPAVASSGGLTAYTFPALARVGLLDGLELRAGSAALYTVTRSEDEEQVEGFGDVEVGFKAAAAASDGFPAVALVAGLVLPTGEDGFTSGEPVLNVATVGGFTLPDGLALTATVSAAAPTAADGLLAGGLVLALGRSFTETVAGYVEGGYFLVEDPEDDVANDPLYVGAGTAYLVSPTLQLDAFIDIGLSDAAADLLAGLGLSTRF
jgi:hypothetical protein